MTRDGLKQAMFDILRADKERCWDTPAVETDAIMALVDRYSVGCVLDFHHARVDGAYVQATEQEALEWLKARK